MYLGEGQSQPTLMHHSAEVHDSQQVQTDHIGHSFHGGLNQYPELEHGLDFDQYDQRHHSPLDQTMYGHFGTQSHEKLVNHELPLHFHTAPGHHDQFGHGTDTHHQIWHPPPQSGEPFFEKQPARQKHLKKDPPGVPLRRDPSVNPFKPRSARNETPMFESTFLEEPHRTDSHHHVWHPPPQTGEPFFEKQPPRHRHLKKDPPGVPLRRDTSENPFHPRSERNETPMYVRPYLEDPVWLEPDDHEIELLHELEDSEMLAGVSHQYSQHHHNIHDLPGDPDLENPQDEEIEEYEDADDHIINRHNDLTRNETPMYVRPYLEDPVWLQPDDDEMEQLYDL